MITIDEIIEYLKEHHIALGIELKPGASAELIKQVEEAYNIKFPNDIRRFYEFTNGLGLYEDFNIVSLEDLIDNNIKWPETKFLIAEYLIYCDGWELMVDKNDHNDYQIINGTCSNFKSITLTNSFTEFLTRYFKGLLFEKNGIYEWYNELVLQKITTSAEAIAATFKIENTFRLSYKRETGLVLFGEITDGEILAGDVIYIKIKNQMRVIHIRSWEDVRATNQNVIGLVLALGNREWDDEIKKLIGSTINIYSFN